MKRMLFLSFSLFLVYMAGMYRYPALMALGVGQALFLLFLTVQNRVCGRRMQAAFEREAVAAVKGEPVSCELALKHGGKLPPGGMGFLIRYGYGERKRWKRLYGDGGEAVFRIRPEYCGAVRLHLEAFWVYDYFSLGRVRKKASHEMRVMVFPGEQALDIRFPEDGHGREPEADRAGAAPPSGGGGVFQVREYRKGDSARHVHWKLSARAGQPLIKEQEQEKRRQAVLCLDLEGHGEAGQQDRDRFYELLSATILGLLREREEVLVNWRDGALGTASMEITQDSQCRELLSRLYLTERSGGSFPAERDTDFVLGMGLGLFQGDRELYRFSGEGLAEELGKVRILARG